MAQTPDRPGAPGPPAAPVAAGSPAGPVLITRGELWWLSFSVWFGGVFVLTLLPILLSARLGMLLGVAASYLIFFIAWHPIQQITQRTFGIKTGILRMFVFTGTAVMLALVFRQLLVGVASP